MSGLLTLYTSEAFYRLSGQIVTVKHRYVVQTDPKTIDGLLAEVWPEESRHWVRLLVYHQASPIAGEVQAYARYLSNLVWGHLSDFQTVAPAGATLDDLTKAACG